MAFDFTSIIPRQGHDALAVEALGLGSYPKPPKEGFDPIPMWVADMSFPTVPAIPQALAQRAAHPLYGYFLPTEAYYQAIITWQQRRNGVTGLEAQHIGYENGVLGGLITALNVFCSRGEEVLIHSPTYIGFTNSLLGAGYRIALSPLVLDGDNIWRMDFADMEKKFRDRKIRTMIFCSPHNPTGRVWERSELEELAALCRRYDVSVICDEIWSDLLMPGRTHIPLQQVNEDMKQRTVALYAPSKTFNLAGLVGSYHIAYNPRLRLRLEKEGSVSHYNNMNVLSMHALIAGYSAEGEAWLEELRQVICGNVDLACASLAQHAPQVRLSRPQGTYMLFLDCTDWCAQKGKSLDELLQAGWDVGVAWQDGRPFHGPCHIRMNLALPRSRAEEAFRRLEQYVW